MHRMILDCDNTMGISGCDVDDGLTLLYLLGRKDVVLEGVTLTYGNNNIDVVEHATLNLMNDLKLPPIKIYKGSQDHNNRISPASEFLATMAANNPGEITVLAIGALTNLYGAYMYDSNFFSNVKNIVLMGGITEELIINGTTVHELNFSCDPEAAHVVLSSTANVSVLNGHTTAQALFGAKELSLLQNSNEPLLHYIYKNIEPWCSLMEGTMDLYGFCNWDAAAAVFITNPELFVHQDVHVDASVLDLKRGYMKVGNKGKVVNMPREIVNLERLNTLLIDAWIEIGSKLNF